MPGVSRQDIRRVGAGITTDGDESNRARQLPIPQHPIAKQRHCLTCKRAPEGIHAVSVEKRQQRNLAPGESTQSYRTRAFIE